MTLRKAQVGASISAKVSAGLAVKQNITSVGASYGTSIGIPCKCKTRTQGNGARL